MFKKRGQAAIFMVVLIVVTVATFLGLYLQKNTDTENIRTESQKVVSIEEREVRAFVQECLDLTAKNSLFYLGFVGGRLTPDPFNFYYEFDQAYRIPYYYYGDVNQIPVPYDESYWTGLLDRYMGNYFEACINNFQHLPIQVDHGTFSSNTEFTDENVVFTINFPVTVMRDSKEVRVEERYTKTIPVRLRSVLDFATTIVEKKVKNDLYIHWDFLTQFTGTGFNATAYTENDHTIIYRVVDLENEIDDEPFILQFANKVIE